MRARDHVGAVALAQPLEERVRTRRLPQELVHLPRRAVAQQHPEALDLVLHGKVAIEPYVERRPLREVNQALADLKEHRVKRRIVLVP